MNSLSRPNQVLPQHQLLLIQCPSNSTNQTLPQFCLLQKPKELEKQSICNQTQFNNSQKGLKLKFNICEDNLKCFMPKPKAEIYRSISSRLSKQSRSEASLQTFRLDLKQSKYSDVVQTIKSQTQRNYVQQNLYLEGYQEDNLSTILSNEIIHWIEKKGIRYNWNDGQANKWEPMPLENKEDEQQIKELFDAFSDNKYAKKSVRQSFSTNQSFLTENSLIQGDDTARGDAYSNNQFSGYEAMSYNYHFEQMADQSFDKNYSLASTVQPYASMYYPMHMYAEDMSVMMTPTYGLKSMPSTLFPSGQFIIRPQGLGKDPRTTLMIKNIPNKYTIQFLSDEIDQDFSNYYDFLYLPCDTKSGANQGYGFINFTDLEAIRRFYEQFHNKKWRRFRSQKICNLTYARLQGITSLIEHFQNSKVLNHKQKKYQPIIKKLNQQIHNLIKEQQIAHQSTQLRQK